MNRKELIEKINSLEIIQRYWYDDENFPEEISDILDTCDEVAHFLHINKHRWYETSVVVYKLNDEYFGIRYVTDLFSESSSIYEMYWTLEAFPMKEVKTITYEVE